MPVTVGGIIIQPPSGSSVLVNITFGEQSHTAVMYTAKDGGTAATLPATLTTPTTYHADRAGIYTISCQINGVEIASNTGTTISVGIGRDSYFTVVPQIDLAEITAQSGSYVQPSRATKQLRAVALRSNPLGASTYLSAAGNTSATYRIQHPVLWRAAGLRLAFANFSGGVYFGDFALKIKASIEYNGKVYPCTFNGSLTGVLETGGPLLLTDPSPVTLDPVIAGSMYTRTFVQVGAGDQWPIGLTPVNANGEGSSIGAPGTDLTGVGQYSSPSNPAFASAGAFSPVAVLGVPESTLLRTAGIMGDSIVVGAGDGGSSYGTMDTTADYGFILRGLNRTIPYVFVGAKFAETAQTAATYVEVRSAILEYCTSLICQYGTNDVNNTRTAAQMEADLLKLWRLGMARGIPVYQTTIVPRTTSSDSWVTVNNQTAHANDAARTALNDWLRAGSPIDPTSFAAVAIGTSGAVLAGQTGHPLAGYFETADTVESARNSGKWKAAYTDDGVHPNATGSAAAAASITTSLL